MTTSRPSDIDTLVEDLVAVVEGVLDAQRDRLIDMAVRHDRQARVNERHPDNFLTAVDLELHDLYRERLPAVLGRMVYASEEGDPELLGSAGRDAEHVAIVDPLDTSELAVRGLVGYTHVVIYSVASGRPVAAVVGDFFHEIHLYVAHSDGSGDRAWLRTRSGSQRSLQASGETDPANAVVTSYTMRPSSRFLDLAAEEALLLALASDGETGRIGVDFGSVGLCHVAAGFTDAMIELAKGFPLWDFLPGQYILEAAGGVVRSLDGAELPLDLDLSDPPAITGFMSRRQRFVAAGSPQLAATILELLGSERTRASE